MSHEVNAGRIEVAIEGSRVWIVVGDARLPLTAANAVKLAAMLERAAGMLGASSRVAPLAPLVSVVKS